MGAAHAADAGRAVRTRTRAGEQAAARGDVRSPKGSGSHWVRNIFAIIGALVVAGIIIGALSGGASSGSSPPSADSAGSPSSSPSSICTANACIASDAEGLKGTVAKDTERATTKVACRASTVKQVASGTYTVDCTVTYSDGSVGRHRQRPNRQWQHRLGADQHGQRGEQRRLSAGHAAAGRAC